MLGDSAALLNSMLGVNRVLSDQTQADAPQEFNMANWFESIGYGIGRLHTGMLGYMCDLYQEGLSEPLVTVLSSLGLRPPKSLTYKTEWDSIDLALFENGKDKPWLLLETKVDDHEGETSRLVAGAELQGKQTAVYSAAHPGCDAYLYLTLGMGEYFHAPYAPRFQWIRVKQFLRALDGIATNDPAIGKWRGAIRAEVARQDRVLHGAPSDLTDYRTGSWNIYFLGQLKELLEKRWKDAPTELDATCYTHGARPDTILNFGFSRAPKYLEINNNGTLNLKVDLSDYDTPRGKSHVIGRIAKEALRLHKDVVPMLRQGGKIGMTKTVASFDIGLFKEGDALRLIKDENHTINRLIKVLSTFYASD
jgi:hypothetical protein